MTTLDMTPDAKPNKTAPGWFVAAAWSVPALMATDLVGLDLGYLAIVPAVAMLVATLRERSVRALRWWVGLTTVLLTVPMFYDGDSGAGYITDMHPINVTLLAISALVVLAKVYRSHR